MLVPDASPAAIARLEDTSPKDRHVLAAAAAAGAHLVVTRNVADFGRHDLQQLAVSAAHPDLFLPAVMTPDMYRATLEQMCQARSKPPNTPAALHAAVGAGHSRLFQAMTDVYPGVTADARQDAPPKEIFRGDRCLKCGRQLADPASLGLGVGPECRQ